MMGLSNGYINSMRKGLGYDKLEQISISFPELNIGWLLTGEGSMLKDENSNSRSILVPTLETRINVSQQEKQYLIICIRIYKKKIESWREK